MAEGPLAGRIALVTGGARGIGAATALALAEAGADIAIADVSPREAAAEVVAAIEALGVRATTWQANLADPAAAADVVAQVAGTMGRLDVLVNNAGITRDNLAIRMSVEDWDLVIAVDLSAAFHVSKAALRPMLKQRWGRIINVSSVAGVMGNAGQANYSAAKAGLIGLTKTLCREVGSRNITVNAVAPGFISTSMTAALPEQVLATAIAAVPLGRAGTPQDVAAAIRFLALPEAGYITGHVLHVDGGMAA